MGENPDRYGHAFQFLDAGEGSGEKKVIERTEAVRHILAIMKKLGVRWQRTPNASLDPIPPGAKHPQAIVENSHKADDECFLMIHAERCQSTAQFLMKAQQWQDTWNCYRPSYGINMHGRTPKEKLIASKTMIQNHVIQFPVLLMDYVLKSIDTFTASLKLLKAGKYVHTKCRKWVTFFSYP